MQEKTGKNCRLYEIKRAKVIWGIVCIAIFFVMLILNYNGYKENDKMQKVYNLQDKISTDFKNTTSETAIAQPFKQDEKMPAIVLVNVGDAGISDVSPDNIENIMLMVFDRNDKKGFINFIAVQKEIFVKKKNNKMLSLKTVFDKDDPQQFCETIEKMLDYKVDGLITYNNKTINDIMGLQYIVKLYVDETNRQNLNPLQKKYEKQYNGDAKEIDSVGYQALNNIQTISFANMYSSGWDKEWSDWCQLNVIRELVKGIKNGNLAELEKMKDIVLKDNTLLSEDVIIKLGARIKAYKIGEISRFPIKDEYVTFGKIKLSFPINYDSQVKKLHRNNKEKKYRISKKAEKFRKIIIAGRKYISEYKIRKSIEKEKKNSENSSNSEGSTYSNNGNDSSGNKAQKSNNSNGKNNSTKSKKSVNTDPVEPTPPPTPEPEPTPHPEPQPQPEENNSSDVLEE